MFSAFQNVRRDQLAGLLFVVSLHSMVLYGLWSSNMIPTLIDPPTLMVELINPTPPKQRRPRLSETPIPPEVIKPPKLQQLVAEAPIVKPNERAAPPPPPVPIVVAPPFPPHPVTLSSDLSVSCPDRTPPDYPAYAKRMNEQGRVVLRVELNVDGRVLNAVITTGSGFSRLDHAAVDAVKTWRCKPAISNGMAVVAVAFQPFVFSLEGQ